MTVMIINERYKLEQQLGQGRLSTVFRAQDIQTNQTIALKILQPHLRVQTSVVQRFKREMAAVQRLDHPAIVRVFDISESPQHLAMAMEYAQGQTLKSWLFANGAMSPARVDKLARTILDALIQAHLRGVLHRDLNLENVIFDETDNDRIEIIGFGLARVDELVGLTMHTRVLGTLETTAPEALLGKAIDAQADLFSVGAMLYQLLTTRPLHDGRMSSALAFAAHENYLTTIHTELRAVLQDQHPALFQTIVRALMPDPSLRFATAAQMLDALSGHYNDRVWSELESHTAQVCEQCSRPLLHEVQLCLHCGYGHQNLLRNPGRGHYVVQITAHTTDASDTPTLSSAVVDTLYDFLLSYKDTRSVFYADPGYYYPPYLLFDALTKADAERVQAALPPSLSTIVAPSGSPLLQKPSRPHRLFLPLRVLKNTFKALANPYLLTTIAGFYISFYILVSSAKVGVSTYTVFSGSEVEITGFHRFIDLLFVTMGLLAVSGVSTISAFLLPFIYYIGIHWITRTPMSYEDRFTPYIENINHYRPTLETGTPPHRSKAVLAILCCSVFFTFISVMNWAPQLIGKHGLYLPVMFYVVAIVAVYFGEVVGGYYQRLYKRDFRLKSQNYEIMNAGKVKTMMPGKQWLADKQQHEENPLPEDLLQALLRLDDSALKTGFHDVLKLTLRLFQDDRVPRAALQEALRPLFDFAITWLAQLPQKQHEESASERTDRLIGALSRIDKEIESSTDTEVLSRLFSQRKACLDELDGIDEVAENLNLLRHNILEIRATLVDLQSRFNQSELPSLELVHQEISELKIRFESRQEVEELLEYV